MLKTRHVAFSAPSMCAPQAAQGLAGTIFTLRVTQPTYPRPNLTLNLTLTLTLTLTLHLPSPPTPNVHVNPRTVLHVTALHK